MRQLLAGIKQNNLSRIFCYILWTFSSYSGKVSITFSSSPVRWATFFLIILIIFCCFAGEAILTWSLSNDIDGLPTSLINPFWHLLEQTVILLWSGTHHHQLEKKIEYPFADVKQFQNQLQLQAQSIYVLYWKRRTLFPGPLCDGLVLFFKTSFADSYVLVTLHKVVCLSSEFIYAGKYTSKQVRIPSISFWCNQCFKSHN